METFEELKKQIKEHLKQLDDEDTQDIYDSYLCALTYLNLTRCKICHRISNEGYLCLHCGQDDSLIEEEEDEE